MNFKEPTDLAAWERYEHPEESTPEGIQRMMRVVVGVDELLRGIGQPGLTITSFIRAGDEKSYHSIGQAVDIRIRGLAWPWRLAVWGIFKALRKLDPRIQLDPHWDNVNKTNQHFHFEYDDGALRRKKAQEVT